MFRVAIVLLLSLTPAYGAEILEQFTGTAGVNVSGWTLTSDIATWDTPTFKYQAGGVAEVAGMVQVNDDHGATMDSINGGSGTIELLTKFKPSGWSAGGNMIGPFAFFSWVEDAPGMVCNHGITISVQDGSITIHEWTGLNIWDECGRDTYSASKDAGFAVTDTWYIARLRISGTSKMLKVWRPDVESEPVNWEINTSAGMSYSGDSGIMLDPTNNLSATMTVDWFVAATAGDTASNPDGAAPTRRVLIAQ